METDRRTFKFLHELQRVDIRIYGYMIIHMLDELNVHVLK